MHPYIRKLARATAVLGLTACAGVADDILSITDPDLLSPEEMQSASGANAVRLGAISRLNYAVSGVESVHMLGGLFTDEWRSGDSFVDRDQTDKRDVVRENSFATTANRNLHRARVTAEIAAGLMATFSTTAPTWQRAEMFFIMGYTVTMLAETYCNGVPLSTVVDGVEQPGGARTTAELYTLALAHVDSGLAIIGAGTTADHNRVRNSLLITRGRILLNQNNHAAAATAVAAVPTAHRHQLFHTVVTSPNNQQNQLWALNNSARRYNVGDGEGIVGINFASGDPRVPTCAGGSAACVAAGASGTVTFDLNTTPPFRAQLLWTSAAASFDVTSGVEARLIEAEAQIRGNAAGGTYLSILNALRATVPGLAPLADAGSEAARIDQLYRERAFWLFGRGHRLGDLRRLVRQHNRAPNSVWPNGPHHKGGTYGTEMNFPIPQAEDNNPQFTTPATNPGRCIDRNA